MANLRFDNQYISSFAADECNENVPRQVTAVYSLVMPKVCQQPTMIAINEELANIVGLAPYINQPDYLAQLLTGSSLLEGMQPYACNYGGHQFGHWAGQLGDGRAINLGQVLTCNNQLLTMQLKGAGPTPYSRAGDGFAVLRSSLREYLCSEAMHHLGIPTTRALSLCLTGEQVARDMFYDGNVKLEPGAIVCRVSSSFVRFGSFQLPAMRGDLNQLKQLVDYVIEHDFEQRFSLDKQGYLHWFKEVSERTCDLIVDWMRVGFVHGVMNTDNMSIIGETIDYGPYGWIDNFDLHWTPNTTDRTYKRYCFGAQPEIAQWNVFQLANALYPLIEEADALNQVIGDFAQRFQQKWLIMMASKLGLTLANDKEDEAYFAKLEQLLTKLSADMTMFYRYLAMPLHQVNDLWEYFLPCFYYPEQINEQDKNDFLDWLKAYSQRIDTKELGDAQRIESMNRVNPKYVLRNYLAQQAIEKATIGDYQELNTLITLLKNPYDEQPHFSTYGQKRPIWAEHKAGCSMLSCSS